MGLRVSPCRGARWDCRGRSASWHPTPTRTSPCPSPPASTRYGSRALINPPANLAYLEIDILGGNFLASVGLPPLGIADARRPSTSTSRRRIQDRRIVALTLRELDINNQLLRAAAPSHAQWPCRSISPVWNLHPRRSRRSSRQCSGSGVTILHRPTPRRRRAAIGTDVDLDAGAVLSPSRSRRSTSLGGSAIPAVHLPAPSLVERGTAGLEVMKIGSTGRGRFRSRR